MKTVPLALALMIVPSVGITNHSVKHTTAEDCMRANIYFEARNQTLEGMKAVAKVTMNRTKSKAYPDSVCKVVFQSKQFSWTHQKSWGSISKMLAGDITRLKGKDIQAYLKADTIATEAVKNKLSMPKLKDSLHYHATYVKPKWANRMQKVAQIDSHIFYSNKGMK